MSATEMIIVEITKDEVNGGYSAITLGYGIHAQEDMVNEIRRNAREAEDCYFDEGMPRLIRLHFVQDKVLGR